MWAYNTKRMGDKLMQNLQPNNLKKMPLERPSRRWMNIIKIILEDMGYEDVYWIELTQDKILWQDLVNTIISLMDFAKG